MTRFLRSLLPISLVALGFEAQAQTSAQFEAQRQQKYRYSTFSAMGSPVVLPMDGKTQQADWLTGLDVSLADMIFPHLHMDTAYGTSSLPQEELAAGHHDPTQRDGFTLQNIEFGLSGRLNQHNEFFVTLAGNVTPGGQYNPIFEEAFWKFKDLPGGFELRLGRVYNRFGIQNTYHPHGFDWVDQYLVNTRMLGDDSLTTLGAELTYFLPTGSSAWLSQFDLAVGRAPSHDGHAHHGEEEEEEHSGPHYAADDSYFSDDDLLTVLNWTNVYNITDFHQWRAGLSGAWGGNLGGELTSVYGSHAEYQWRQNGLEPGGQYFRLRGELMLNDFKVPDEEGEYPVSASQNDFGGYLSALYGLNDRWELGLRYEQVAGNHDTEQDSRRRISPGITWYANDARTLRLRLQYNHDHSNARGTDHAIWLQACLNWGGPEVR